MPSPTYVALATTVLTGSQASVTLSSIPSTYTDLVLSISVRSSRAVAAEEIYLLFNSSSIPQSSWSYTNLQGYSSTASSDRGTAYGAGRIIAGDAGSATANTFASIELYIPNYAGSTNKVASVTGVTENNSATLAYTYATALLLGNTAAISSIYLQPANGTFDSGSRFDLYGIKSS